MAPRTTAAAGKPRLSTKRSRKSRTEIVESSSSSSSSSSSDSESSSSAESAPVLKSSKKQKIGPISRDKTTASSPSSSGSDSNSGSSSSSADSEELPDAVTPSAAAAAAAFPSWYLRTVTQELAEDLDKVRCAPDFGDAALPLLVHALQQGEACFSPAEKARVMGTGGGAAAKE